MAKKKNKDKNVNDLIANRNLDTVWNSFEQTGELGFYLLYKKLKDEGEI